MPVIDAHSHIYPDKIACKASSAVGDFYGVDMNAKNASASSMLAACEGSPITHHLVHSVATTPGQVPIINDFIAEQCRAHDNFVGFATMHQDFEDVEGEINRALEEGSREAARTIVSSVDASGHGTAVAGIAAGDSRGAAVGQTADGGGRMPVYAACLRQHHA